MTGRRLAVAATIVLTALTAACGGDAVGGPSPTPKPTLQKPPVAAPNMAGRGEIVSATPFPALITRAEAGAVIAASGATGAFVPRYDVVGYVVRYRTPGLNGQLTEATGAVYMPATSASGPTSAPMVAYMHGTVTSRTNVPSNPLATEGRLFGTAYATDGAIVVLPDYLGLGGSTGTQLYLHQQTHASAAIDLLRAARTLANQRALPVDRTRLSLTGYSQGGAVALGLLRELEANYTTEFPVQAVAAMSGPYDVSGT
ncbi:MAG: hypothetical protein IBJ03_13995, partial [Gemmatimonadaceae bacterium]|nr:hypothetical protein [Gemmatimonadaceae bacterium]